MNHFYFFIKKNPVIAIGCGDPPVVAGGFVADGGDFIGSLRLIHCNDDYQLSGPDFVFCSFLSKKWTQPGICNLGKSKKNF